MATKSKSKTKAAMPKKTVSKKAEKKTDLPEWETKKSGAMRHRDGVWYAYPFLKGWYFYPKTFDNNLGPFKTFEEGLTEWKKQK